MRREPLSDVYLDTSVIVAAIVAGSTNSQSSTTFCAELAEDASRVYFSSILRVELSQAIRQLATKRDRLDPVIREQFGLDQWQQDFTVRQRWMAHGIQQFDQLLGTFAEIFELPFRQAIWRTSVNIMVDHFLSSQDAIHVATAREYDLRAFATTDDDFTRIPDLEVILIRDN